MDDPPYLSVGTGVSAKYKGAFCEAKVSKVIRIVKCKVNNKRNFLLYPYFDIYLFQVTYKMGLGNATLSDEQIKGTLRVGQLVQAKHPDRKELVEATITKIQDCSQYTVGKKNYKILWLLHTYISFYVQYNNRFDLTMF